MATLFLYSGILLAICAMAVLGLGLRQLSRENKSLSRGAVLTLHRTMSGGHCLVIHVRVAGLELGRRRPDWPSRSHSADHRF